MLDVLDVLMLEKSGSAKISHESNIRRDTPTTFGLTEEEV